MFASILSLKIDYVNDISTLVIVALQSLVFRRDTD